MSYKASCSSAPYRLSQHQCSACDLPALLCVPGCKSSSVSVTSWSARLSEQLCARGVQHRLSVHMPLNPSALDPTSCQADGCSTRGGGSGSPALPAFVSTGGACPAQESCLLQTFALERQVPDAVITGPAMSTNLALRWPAQLCVLNTAHAWSSYMLHREWTCGGDPQLCQPLPG